jgi:2',3'-cyclic-nucleotide 2'-phosphodiesterase
MPSLLSYLIGRPRLDNLQIPSADSKLKLAYFGDIVGKAGKAGLRRALPKIKDSGSIDLVFVNGENIAGGIGIDSDNVRDLKSIGVDLISLGDHAFHKKGYEGIFSKFNFVTRPANIPKGAPGEGLVVLRTSSGINVALANILGRVFMGLALDCPFQTMELLLDSHEVKAADIFIVDFHAETTAEKIAFAKCFDGSVSLIVGTHTHVQTNDAQILPNGTAYITDLGMCGPDSGVIGMDFEVAIKRLKSGLPAQYKPAVGNPILNWVEVEFINNRAVTIINKREIVKI